MEVLIICQYCGRERTRTVYNQNSLVDEKCDVCGDSNLTIKDLAKSKIDTYAGSPAFPEKDDEEDTGMCNVDAGWPWNMGGD